MASLNLEAQEIYDFNGVPVEFAFYKGATWCFMIDVTLPNGSGRKTDSGAPIAYMTNAQAKSAFGNDVHFYRGESGKHRRLPRKNSALVKVGALKERTMTTWKQRNMARDFAAFLDRVDADMKKRYALHTPVRKPLLPTTDQAQVNKERPAKVGVSERLEALESEVRRLGDLIETQNQHSAVELAPPKVGLWGRFLAHLCMR